MMPFSVRSSVVRGLLILGVVMVMLLIAWVALQLSGPQLDWFEEAQGRTPYFAYWRTLLYTLIFAGWTAALRLRSRPDDQHRLLRLGLIGFSSIILVELSRV
ncbi:MULTISPECIES: hypothetical protein [Pseudomonas]|jgi:hypothetical protein|uniref:Uncharacterized protein n=1 Tax=Pseudomonas putida (strain W619) TaxID=390235 RepID=B1JB45_PSEPW|nr:MULTISPECIES: hypothetical protein [Pseudomonas]AJG12555.1 hypothetical protein RK21_01047 [Pseudomonas plecoglossicida]EIU1414800.1 hypothetical protein [Pseudomonas aeruginosa]EKT4450903.1 hypothetical protein [Pseudomonas putida]KSF98949.1 hypothetical protein AO945_21425 [Pseudomonas aeruginosa]KSO14041.1 hypothetical protein APA91_25405 [Pseudomonas aeruginosa]